MATQMTTDRDSRARLRMMSSILQDVHRSLIDFSLERYELAHGVVLTRSELLGLLLGDEAFAWLRPLSRLIVDIDELAAGEEIPTEAEVAEVGRRVEDLTTASDDPEAFGSRYIGLLASEPRVAMNHGEVRLALAVWPGLASA